MAFATAFPLPLKEVRWYVDICLGGVLAAM